jgi:hypothetical protein
MVKNWSTCPRCGRSYQTTTGLPCGIGDCRSAGGSPATGKDRGGPAKVRGPGPVGSGGGYRVEKSCLALTVALAGAGSAILGGLAWGAAELVRHIL